MKVREVAISRNDVRLLALTARDIVAAEADHYHPSCYRDYARPEKLGKIQSGLTEEDTKYQTCENSSIISLFEYIRNNLFSNPRVTSMLDIISTLVSIKSSSGSKASESTNTEMKARDGVWKVTDIFYRESSCMHFTKQFEEGSAGC